MSAEARLAALSLTLPDVPTPVGAYVPALVDGLTVWTSGQIPLVDGALYATGSVGERATDVDMTTAIECARIAALNGLAAIAAAAGGLDRVRRILRVVGYVASAPGFTQQPAVVNGASHLLSDVFGDNGRHARSAIGVMALPLGAPVEIEILAALH